MTRGGILAGTAAIALLAGAVVLAGGPIASAQSKKEAPLDLKGDASERPWKRYAGWPTRDESKYNTLGNLATPPAPTGSRKITAALSGDAKKGAELVADRNRGGSCLACHVMGPAGGANLPGNVAPDLSEIGNAGREDEWLFNYIYDGRVYNPDTVMPPWGSHGFFNDQEINDMVAFLKTLKSPAAFKTWAASMPKWEPRLNKVLGVEEFVTRHAKATTGANWLMETDDNLAMSVYLRFLANGTPIKVDTDSAEAKAAIERGKQLSQRKVGQLNMACTDCHGKVANHWIRGQWLGEPKGQYDHFPTWRTSLLKVWDIRQRFQWCQVNIRADELPPDAKEYGDLELYLASQNEGLNLSVPGIRH